MNNGLLLLVLLAAVALRCGVAPLAGGSTDTELGSVVTGMVLDEKGMPSFHAKVHLVPQEYNPVTGVPLPENFSDTTDSAGGYEFNDVPAGGYTVFAADQRSEKRLLITGVMVDTGDMEEVHSDTLRPTGSIAVEFATSIDTRDGFVYIPGTFYYAPVVTRQGVLNGIPSGCIPSVRYIDKADTVKNYAVYNDATVISYDTVYITDYHSWGHTATIYLNTSAAGADVSNDVAGFPVLVRLSGDNFPFSEAKGRGEDLRFTKSNGSPLSYQIESWDSANGSAAVWVKVDTIYGNNSTQTITMYWGNSISSDGSSGASVFDTANGFVGVWHLGESSGNAGDVTENRFDGSRIGNLKRIAGAIGYGQYFDGAGDYFEMGNVWNPDTSGFTVSAWVKPSATGSYRAILSKSYGDSPSATYGWLVELGEDGALAAFTATDTGSWGDVHTYVAGSNAYITDTASWHYVTAVFDRSGNTYCRLYIDGVDIPPFRGGGDITGVGPIVNAAPMRIGADAKGGCPWQGVIDECSLAAAVRSPDWVKLCYMNQKTDDRLVTLRIDNK